MNIPMRAMDISGAAMRNRSGVLLEIDGVTSHYGRIQALHGIHIQVNEGQLVALVGANGAGKSTLLRAISGVHPVSAGTIRFNGRDLAAMPAHARVAAGICQVPEGRQVFAPMSVEDNIRLGAYRLGDAAWEREKEKMYSLFPVLKEKRRLLAGNLSGGQQQMLAMARALMGKPKLLLLDEPSMGLAPLLVQDIFRIIVELRNQRVTILLVEQNAFAALSIADRGYVMETGTISMQGTGVELLNDDKVRSAYLGM
jgi:branched-chain amino acid transport system ATP-binding protein